MTAMLNFIVIFPQEQGVSFEGSSNHSYLVIESNKDLPINSSLSTINEQSEDSFNDWDVEVGFLGSNSIKQGSKQGVKSYTSNIFSNLLTIGTELFGENSPILYAIGIFFTLSLSYLVYIIIKFVRTGQ